MAAFRRVTYDAIFGEKKYLRPGEDDDKLLHLLEVDSDIEGYDLEEDELDDGVFQEQDTARGDIVEMAIEEENVLEENDEDNDQIEGLDDEIVEISTSNEQVQQDEYDSEDNVPLKFEIQDNGDTSLERINFTPSDYFSKYMDDNMFQTICDSTNVKYMLLHEKPLNLTLTETKHFFGISILMSLLKYSRVRMYWAKTTRVYSIASVMTRDRYFKIRNHLKIVVDNDISEHLRKSDKLWKETCLSLPRENVVAVDEQMIPFTGICGIKQFVRGKPNPEGLKNFVCATPTGLVLDFEVYQGKDTFLDNTAKDLGVGPSAVVRLVQTLREGSQIFMDRYFTTIPLLEYLLDNKLHGTGTIMKSRIPRSVQLTSESTLKRLGRGATEQSIMFLWHRRALEDGSPMNIRECLNPGTFAQCDICFSLNRSFMTLLAIRSQGFECCLAIREL
ncbi:hypothetical protein NQ318_014808 [Aromia moschata]|uniref:PiggyBac transposable element-derived protein domain-containing protein n=1 Tax=Aromia moschata TaxID=1265417 RepID=A0AAV8ZBP1_9CUCU|nr:hypothetical protein NQ318_014808 [Aromia moschata]